MTTNEEIKRLEELYIKAKLDLLAVYVAKRVSLDAKIKKTSAPVVIQNEFNHLEWSKLMNGALYEIITPSEDIPNPKKFIRTAKRIAKANNKHVQIKRITKDKLYMQFTGTNTDPSQKQTFKGEPNE